MTRCVVDTPTPSTEYPHMLPHKGRRLPLHPDPGIVLAGRLHIHTTETAFTGALTAATHTMDLSLPKIIDLTTHQRRRAEKALAIAHRRLTVQEDKVKRLRTFIDRLPELVAAESEYNQRQLEKHREAARREYDQAVAALEHLHTVRENLQRKVEAKIDVERIMETLTVSSDPAVRTDGQSSDGGRHHDMTNIFPMVGRSHDP